MPDCVDAGCRLARAHRNSTHSQPGVGGMCSRCACVPALCLQVRARLDEVLAQVDLADRFGDLVGTPGLNGLPTAARKRLTIAVELMSKSPVLFMDEPTSGEARG